MLKAVLKQGLGNGNGRQCIVGQPIHATHPEVSCAHSLLRHTGAQPQAVVWPRHVASLLVQPNACGAHKTPQICQNSFASKKQHGD